MDKTLLVPVLVAAVAALPSTVGIAVVWLENKTRFDSIDRRFAEIDRRFGEMDRRSAEADRRATENFAAVHRRFDDMRDLWRAELRRVEEVLDARLKHLEER